MIVTRPLFQSQHLDGTSLATALVAPFALEKLSTLIELLNNAICESEEGENWTLGWNRPRNC